MKNYDESVEINHNPNWSYISSYSYRILTNSGSDQTKLMRYLLNLINQQIPYIDKIYLYVKDQLESKYQLLINGREIVGIQELESPKLFIDVNENLEDYNPTKKRQVLIVFDDVAEDREANEKLSPIVTK